MSNTLLRHLLTTTLAAAPLLAGGCISAPEEVEHLGVIEQAVDACGSFISAMGSAAGPSTPFTANTAAAAKKEWDKVCHPKANKKCKAQLAVYPLDCPTDCPRTEATTYTDNCHTAFQTLIVGGVEQECVWDYDAVADPPHWVSPGCPTPDPNTQSTFRFNCACTAHCSATCKDPEQNQGGQQQQNNQQHQNDD